MDMDGVLSRVIDICSSGPGGELEGWHFKTLRALFDEHLTTEHDREVFFSELFVPNTFNSDGWQISDLRAIKELLNIEKSISITI